LSPARRVQSTGTCAKRANWIERLQAGGLELALKRLLPNLMPPGVKLEMNLAN